MKVAVIMTMSDTAQNLLQNGLNPCFGNDLICVLMPTHEFVQGSIGHVFQNQCDALWLREKNDMEQLHNARMWRNVFECQNFRVALDVVPCMKGILEAFDGHSGMVRFASATIDGTKRAFRNVGSLRV